MGLRINHNVNAVNALRNLRNADRLQSTSLERLSSGLRINRASDDPAGLVISEQFRSQIAGIESIRVDRDLGLVDGHWDLALVSEHEDNAALEAYQVHPLHKEAAAFIASVVSDRAVVDYSV